VCNKKTDKAMRSRQGDAGRVGRAMGRCMMGGWDGNRGIVPIVRDECIADRSA